VRSARSLALLGVLGTLALTGCGGAHTAATSPPAAATASGSTVPKAATADTEATVRTANCRLWNVLDAGDRKRLVLGLRTFFGGSVDVPGERGQVLPDDRAYTMLTSYCRQSFAGAFMLYRLYGDAAAFNPSGQTGS
jgi:hypothetical protein